VSKRARPTLTFATVDEAIADVERLRRDGAMRAGNWSLPQACWHLNAVLKALTQPATMTEPSPEHLAFRKMLREKISLPGGATNIDAAPPSVPPADVDAAAVDQFIAGLRDLARSAEATIGMGPLGPMPLHEAVHFHLNHAAHHLGFLAPKKPLRSNLKYESVQALIDDVTSLRKGYRQSGNWSLAQNCWHIGFPMMKSLAPATETTPTPEQTVAKEAFYKMLAGAKVAQLAASPAMTPAATAGDAEIDAFLATLDKLKNFTASHVAMGPFGPVPIVEYTQLQLMHAAHHLSHLAPKAERRQGLTYETIDDAIADIHRLRQGHVQAGNWTLAQICWHLTGATRNRMKPGPFEPNTREQDARAAIFKQVLADRKLPSGLVAPDTMVPPSDADETWVSQFLETLEQLKTHKGPFAPHRLFGNMSDDDSRRQILIHAAHHLSHLVPAGN
jgi:hypothetical protein